MVNPIPCGSGILGGSSSSPSTCPNPLDIQSLHSNCVRLISRSLTTQHYDTSSDIQIPERPVQDVHHMEEQGEMIALKPQDKYQLYLAPQSTRGHQFVIGSMMQIMVIQLQ